MEKATILVVDDEPLVRGVMRDVLVANGHTVLEARFNSEALLMLRQHDAPIHLMIADVMMPGINGPELADMLAPSRPTMKVLYVSGYPQEIVQEKLTPLEMKTFLHKPFRADTLLRTVREVLDQGPRGGPYAMTSLLPCELSESQLGMLYETGVPTDYVEAYKWYMLASITDDDERILVRMKNLRARMTPEQVAKAELSARILTDARKPATTFHYI
jgi:CheY-like chemotaxis protein